MASQALAKLDQARQALIECRSFKEARDIHGVAESAKFYARSAHLSRETQNYAAEISLLAACRAGEFLAEMQRSKGGRPKKTQLGANLVSEYTQTLRDTKTSINAALFWQRLAIIPDGVRSAYIHSIRGIGEITAAGLLKSKSAREIFRKIKKKGYERRIAAAKPKPLQGPYRILYADPPWKYVGLNQADEYGHAERHYSCLTDEQLFEYKPGGGKFMVHELMDKDSVLFLWVTSPLLQRCFAVIKAWRFDYKSSFIWDEVKHNMGHYNSVRHELLLVCTRGSCKPDTPKLVDSVQSIPRDEHSKKPKQFRRIIEDLYDHGRKLELFYRGKEPPEGWDTEGNEATSLTY